MEEIFCWTTVVLAIYLLLGFFGCYEKWFGGPAGITKQTTYWLIRLELVILFENIIFWIGIITVYVTSEQLGITETIIVQLLCGTVQRNWQTASIRSSMKLVVKR